MQLCSISLTTTVVNVILRTNDKNKLQLVTDILTDYSIQFDIHTDVSVHLSALTVTVVCTRTHLTENAQ